MPLPLSPEYRAALKASRKAEETFWKAQNAYRARLIGDDEYLAAAEVHAKASAEFEDAFAAEAARQPEED